MRIADLQSYRALVYPVSFLLFTLSMLSVSSVACPPTSSLIPTKRHLAFSFGTTLINEGHANPGQIVSVVLAIIIGSFSLAMMAPDMQGTGLSFALA